MTRIWGCVQQAQEKYVTGCGNVTETRTSKLLERPLVLHGRFCAAGATRFDLRYLEPHPLRVTYNEDYLNVGTGPGARSVEVLEIGHHVRRTQGYFAGEHAIENLKESFAVLAEESEELYELRLTPRTTRFGKRINRIVVTLDKKSCLLRSLEVDGASGVNSQFRLEITELNRALGEETFRVYRPR